MSIRSVLARYHLGRPALRAQLTVLYAGLVVLAMLGLRDWSRAPVAT